MHNEEAQPPSLLDPPKGKSGLSFFQGERGQVVDRRETLKQERVAKII